MSLRDEIALIYERCERADYDMASDFIDEILALPSGLVAVKECEKCGGSGSVVDYTSANTKATRGCSKCHGTGRTERDLSIAEVVEWAAEWAKPDASREYYYSQDNGKIYILWRGERIMVKERE